MSKAKQSRTDLEKALQLDPDALQGSAYTSLAALYDRVPGWPIGFGDAQKADELLRQALLINPDGIDSLYFWGDHLAREGKYAEAYGAHGYRVESADALLPLLDHCIVNPGVHVIDCPVDYSENDRILNSELRERALAI
ncbi:hypothetical protein PPUJ13061_50100 [Pseudomonas putida]|uniref:Uncharacterized protein n=2 Tax=Pseudomonas putida TaxID=303 RepID=A0A1L7N7G0_PSEPU|nr:Hypothetical protein [Pseudomonas putida DOT-T1E]BAW21381.1 hypothetical protein KF715C_ch8080 [Pseudomonas putida]GLO05108.1 hypothetical protein PPUJ13061_50100 [Pseudomonas putida]